MNQKPRTSTWLVSTLFGLLFLIAAWLRLFALDLVSITADEGIHGQGAMLGVFSEWVQAGPPSVGIRNSPWFIYLLAVANIFYYHPLTGVVFIILLNLSVFYLTFTLAWWYFDRWTALITALLLTFSPWAIIYARNMWPPSAVGILALPLLHMGLGAWTKKQKQYFFGLGFFGIAMPLIHFSGFVGIVWTIFLASFGCWQKQFTWRQLGFINLGILVGFLGWIPWLLFELQEVASAWSTFQVVARGKSEFSWLLLPDYFSALLHTRHFAYWFDDTPATRPDYFPACLVLLLPWHEWLLNTLLVVTCLWIVGYRRQSFYHLALLTWIALPIILLIGIRPKLHPHYLFVVYPIPYLLIADFLSHLCRSSWRVELPFWKQPRPLGICLLIGGWLLGVTILHSYFILGWYRYLDDNCLTGRQRYQLSYRQRWHAVQSILEDTPGRELLLAGSFNGLHPADNWLYHYALSQQRPRPRLDKTRLYWVDEAVGSELEPAAWKILQEQHGMSQGQVERAWQVPPTRIFRIAWPGTPPLPKRLLKNSETLD